jgi:hypothetical protein
MTQNKELDTTLDKIKGLLDTDGLLVIGIKESIENGTTGHSIEVLTNHDEKKIPARVGIILKVLHQKVTEILDYATSDDAEKTH